MFTDDEVRFGGGSAFEDAVVVGVFLNDLQCFGRGDLITEREQLSRASWSIYPSHRNLSRSTRFVSATIASEMSIRMLPARAWPRIRVAGPPKCSALI